MPEAFKLSQGVDRGVVAGLWVSGTLEVYEAIYRSEIMHYL